MNKGCGYPGVILSSIIFKVYESQAPITHSMTSEFPKIEDKLHYLEEAKYIDLNPSISKHPGSG